MEQLGPYVLSHRVGTGGMAEVWMGHRTMLGASKTVAIKLLAPNLASKPEYLAMFGEEARLSMLLNHSNIVHVFELGEDRGEHYMAMEWIDGVNLAELQTMLWECGRALPVELAMYITGEVLRALDYAHNFVHDDAATVVHRDVSPANILLSLAGEVKLTDFGVARFGTEETSGVHVKGKLRYMAPEQLRGCSKAGSVDIYATGAVLHEMLEGSKFRGAHVDDVQLIGSICESTVPELSAPFRVGERLDALRRRMLALAPEERPSAEAALRSLRRTPGYQHAAPELAALVRWCRGLEPRDRTHRPRRMVVEEASQSNAALVRGRSLRCTSVARARRFAAPIAVAFAGLCVGCLGIGFAVSSLDVVQEPQRAETIVVAQAPLVAERREPVHFPPQPIAQPAMLVSVEPLAPPLNAAPPPALAPPTATTKLESSELDALERPKPKQLVKQRHPPVEVEFVAGTFKFAYVKVGNQQRLIEPGGAMKVSPGVHKVYVRFSNAGEWVDFGKLDIRPKRSYRVKLAEPRRLEIKTVD